MPLLLLAPATGCPHLGEHRLAVVGDHHRLVAVERDGRVVERLLGVLQDQVEVGDPALEDAPEVAWDQRPADRCARGQTAAR